MLVKVPALHVGCLLMLAIRFCGAQAFNGVFDGGEPQNSNTGKTPGLHLKYYLMLEHSLQCVLSHLVNIGYVRTELLFLQICRYLTTMKKSDWELSMVTGQVLRQRRLNKNMFEYYERMRYPAGEQVSM